MLRRTLAAALALSTAAALSACVQRESQAELGDLERAGDDALSSVTLQVGDQRGGTEALLTASGELEDLPYDVEFSTFTSGPPQVEALNAGQIDVAVTGNTPPVFGAAAGGRFRVVSAYGGAGEGDQILTHADSPIAGVADLEGARIAVGRGTSAHGNLLRALDQQGLSIDDVEPVYLQPAEAGSAFANREVDAWAIWDPYTAITETEQDVRTLASAADYSNGLWFGLASVDALEDPAKVAAVADLLERLARAGNWSADNLDEWAPAYAEEIGIPIEAAELSQSRSTRQARDLGETLDTQQELLDAFGEAGELEAGTRFEDFVVDEFSEDLSQYVRPIEW